jgi:hypothetical protein
MRNGERIAVLEAEVVRLSEMLLQTIQHVEIHRAAMLRLSEGLVGMSAVQQTMVGDVKEMCTHVSQWVENQGGTGWK